MLLKKAILFFLLSFLALQSGIAQTTPEQKAVVYYYDGSVFRGKIVAEDSVQIILIPSTVIDTLHIAKAFIHKILKDAENVLLYPGGKYHRTVGKFFSYATGFNFSVENNSAAFEFIFGKRLSPKLSVGIGFAFSSHSLNNVQNANNFNNPNNVNDLSLLTGFTPLFAYSRYYFTDKKMRFFASANLGYSLGA